MPGTVFLLGFPLIQFLAHLSRRLKWAIVIAHRPSSVRLSVRRPSSVRRKLSHFRLLLWNRWMEFNETWQEARSQRPLPSLCFSGRSEKQDGRPGLWLAETFSTSPLKPLNGIQRNLTGSKIATPSTNFFFFAGRSEKQDGRPGLWLAETFSTSPLKPLNGIQRNLTGSKISTPSTKYVFFGPIGKTKWHPLASDWLRHFGFLLWNRWTEFNETWQEARSQCPLPSVFFGPIGKTRWPPRPLIGSDIFDFSSETAKRNSAKLDRKQALNAFYHVCVFQANREKNKMASDLLRHFPLLLWNCERNSTKLDRKQDRNALLQVCVFQVDRKNEMAALAYDWLRHFWLLLWNHWTEFNETWQKASSQRPLPSLCFSGWSKKQYGRPGLWLAETYLTFPLKPLNGAPIHVYVWEHIVSLY